MNLLCRGLASLLSLAVLVLSTSAQAPATSASPYSVTGTVVSTVTGAPVPRCRIVAVKVERGGAAVRRSFSQQDSVDADERGHFVLSLPSAGSWSLRVTAAGYRPQSFDQHENFSSSIVLTEQSPTYDLLFRLAPDSAITGVILDEGNEPVRQAQIQVFAVPRPGAEGAAGGRGAATTDDRGRYEVSGLAPGDYRISVQARPWYAAAAQGARAGNAPPLDPSLDVVYPVTWYPGVSDAAAAQVLTLRDGETSQADMQLTPIPAVHLRIPIPVSDTGGGDSNRRFMRFPQITSATGNNFIAMSSSTDAQGQLEVNGLAPGLYRIQTPDESGRPGHSTLIEISANSSRTVDLASLSSSATVNIKIEGGPGTESLPLAFADATNDRLVFRSLPDRDDGGAFQRRLPGNPSQNGTGRVGASLQSARQQATASTDRSSRSLDLPPGQYFIFQSGSANYFLSGITQGAKEIASRLVTIPKGQSSLTIHIATGRATVNGIATLNGKPAVGAMVLLVPVTLDVRGSITEVRRDQTNTDGSFDLNLVIPGQYILVAIDHGWKVKWDDPNTLSRYLLNGVPLDLRTPSIVKQNIEAQSP